MFKELLNEVNNKSEYNDSSSLASTGIGQKIVDVKHALLVASSEKDFFK